MNTVGQLPADYAMKVCWRIQLVGDTLPASHQIRHRRQGSWHIVITTTSEIINIGCYAASRLPLPTIRIYYHCRIAVSQQRSIQSLHHITTVRWIHYASYAVAGLRQAFGRATIHVDIVTNIGYRQAGWIVIIRQCYRQKRLALLLRQAADGIRCRHYRQAHWPVTARSLAIIIIRLIRRRSLLPPGRYHYWRCRSRRRHCRQVG